MHVGAGALSATTEKYVHDGDNLYLQFNSANAVQHRYLHCPLVDQVLADEDFTSSFKYRWPLSDHEMSIRDIVDGTTNALLNHKRYDSFGNIRSETNTSAAADVIFGYTGREFDAETGLQYNRARYYDPRLGRFISQDPTGFAGGDVNLYRYAGNNPLNATDPDGLATRLLGNVATAAGNAVGSALNTVAAFAGPVGGAWLSGLQPSATAASSRSVPKLAVPPGMTSNDWGALYREQWQVKLGAEAEQARRNSIDARMQFELTAGQIEAEHGHWLAQREARLSRPSEPGFLSRLNEEYAITTRLFGLAQTVGGLMETAAGWVVAAAGGAGTGASVGLSSPVTIPVMAAGGTMMVHGLDNAVTGYDTLLTGRYQRTATSQALDVITGDPQTSDFVEAGASIGVQAYGARALYWMSASKEAGSITADKGLDWIVGRHVDMPTPRPAGYQSHHGVSSVWMESNVAEYAAGDAPAVLMRNAPAHNATRGVFNRMRSEVAARQGVSPRNVDWSKVSPGTAWRLAEEQFEAAKVPENVRAEYFRQLNEYLDSLR